MIERIPNKHAFTRGDVDFLKDPGKDIPICRPSILRQVELRGVVRSQQSGIVCRDLKLVDIGPEPGEIRCDVANDLVALIEQKVVPVSVTARVELALPDRQDGFVLVLLHRIGHGLSVPIETAIPHELSGLIVDIRARLKRIRPSGTDY